MRQLFLWHRWLGIGLCIFMALWFISGIVMLFVGYPKLTPTEHLNGLPALSLTSSYIDVEKAKTKTGKKIAPIQIRLSSIAGNPVYIFHYPDQANVVIDAITGQKIIRATPQQALNSARVFYTHSEAHYLKTVTKDAWTQSGTLDHDRPLHVIKINDVNDHLLYIYSHDGQVVLDVTLNERTWGWLGAWLHWIYPLRTMPWWANLIIYLSLTATVMSLIGQYLGIKRWRFSAKYRSGSHSPYAKGFARWHHISGLLFGFILILWIFSGLMSMAPWNIFTNQSQLPVNNFYNGSLNDIESPWSTNALLTKLHDANFHARELSWQKIDGKLWLTAYIDKDQTRVIPLFSNADVKNEIPLDTLLSALNNIAPADFFHYQWLNNYDFYYFSRQEQSMYGNRARPLPILRVIFSDPAKTWLHIDPATGTILSNLDQRQRLSRWLFNLLHSWDLNILLDRPLLRELLMILFSLGGFTISISGAVVGWRRVWRKLA